MQRRRYKRSVHICITVKSEKESQSIFYKTEQAGESQAIVTESMHKRDWKKYHNLKQLLSTQVREIFEYISHNWHIVDVKTI